MLDSSGNFKIHFLIFGDDMQILKQVSPIFELPPF